MYREKFLELLKLVIEKEVDRYDLLKRMLDEFDCENIYDSDDDIVPDIYFTLKHYASGEEGIDMEECRFFMYCLQGKCEYSLEEKLRITTKPPSRQTS